MNYTLITIEFPELDKFDKNIFAVIDLVGDKDYSSAETVPATLGAGRLVKLVLHWGGCFHRNPVNSNVFFRS